MGTSAFGRQRRMCVLLLRFRVQSWDERSGATMSGGQRGAAHGTVPTTVLDGVSSVIHCDFRPATAQRNMKARRSNARSAGRASGGWAR